MRFLMSVRVAEVQGTVRVADGHLHSENSYFTNDPVCIVDTSPAYNQSKLMAIVSSLITHPLLRAHLNRTVEIPTLTNRKYSFFDRS